MAEWIFTSKDQTNNIVRLNNLLERSPTKERKEKKKQGERYWVGGGGCRIRERRRREGQVVLYKYTGIGAVEVLPYS